MAQLMSENIRTSWIFVNGKRYFESEYIDIWYLFELEHNQARQVAYVFSNVRNYMLTLCRINVYTQPLRVLLLKAFSSLSLVRIFWLIKLCRADELVYSFFPVFFFSSQWCTWFRSLLLESPIMTQMGRAGDALYSEPQWISPYMENLYFQIINTYFGWKSNTQRYLASKYAERYTNRYIMCFINLWLFRIRWENCGCKK